MSRLLSEPDTEKLPGFAPASFRAWMKRLNFTNREAALRLGCAVGSVTAWRKRESPLYIGLACSAIESDLSPPPERDRPDPVPHRKYFHVA